MIIFTQFVKYIWPSKEDFNPAHFRDISGMAPMKTINVRLKLNLFLVGPLYKQSKSSIYFDLR